MCETAGRIAAFFTHGQTFGQDRGEVDHRREIIDRHAVRAFCWRIHRQSPRSVPAAYRAVYAQAAMVGGDKVFHFH